MSRVFGASRLGRLVRELDPHVDRMGGCLTPLVDNT